MEEKAPRRPLALRLARAVLIGIGIALLGLSLFAWIAGDAMIFLPRGQAGPSWTTTLSTFSQIREVESATPDGTKLVSLYLATKDASRTILFFHGNGGHACDRAELMAGMAATFSANVFMAGYPGYGRSGGEPSEAGLYAAADAAWAWLLGQGAKPSSVVIYGESLGGGPAIELASRNACAGLVVQSSFTCIPDMARKAIPLFPSHWFMASRIDNLSRIASVRAPKLFFATKRDEVVPYAQTRRLYEKATGTKTWVEFDDCGHNDLLWRHKADWNAAMNRFLHEIAR